MASIYDNIKTAKDLIREVMASGLSTKQEDILRVQDIFGHSTVGELVELANDNGRNDENGNPNPKGSWGCGRKGTYGTFYMVLFNIWNWEDATRFWNEHTNPDRETVTQLRTETSDMKKKIATLENDVSILEKTAKAEHEMRMGETASKLESEKEVESLKAELHDREMKIMALKARLFDMMELSK